MIEYKGQLKDYNYNYNFVKSHKKNGTDKKMCQDIICLDIEVSSFWIDSNNNIITYKKGISNEYYNSLIPCSLPYIWMLGINDTVYYGREFRDLRKALYDIPSDMSVIIWVHNLGYEFQFLLNILKFDNVFASKPRKPMYATVSNIEFRCTYFLTHLSLDDWGKKIGVEKLVGDLDYLKLRTPLTKMSNKEMDYCEHDILIMLKGLKDYLLEYKTLENIPLTQTGRVRRVVKDLLMSDTDYNKFIKTLVPRNNEEYKMLMKAYWGASTHANRYWSGQIIDETITDVIEHWDFTSSYPFSMCSEKYPMSKWFYEGNRFDIDNIDYKHIGYILQVRFKRLNSKTFNTYLSISKADKISTKNIVVDNGKIVFCEDCIYYMTEIDFIIVNKTYSFDDIEILKVYSSEKDYLPKAFINYILELFNNKTQYKDIEGMEGIYLNSKEFVNALYGMMCTAIVQSNVLFDITSKKNMWSIDRLTPNMVTQKLLTLYNGNIREKRYFLSYSWGLYVTAYSRYNLWDIILYKDNDINTIYFDTDSDFLLGKHNFNWYNKLCDNKLLDMCKHYDLDFAKCHPVNKKTGDVSKLGHFTKEPDCSEFITLGAKRYVERRKKDNKLHLTISGINKGAVDCLNNDISNFTDGFVFDKDNPSVKKLLLKYLSNQPTVTMPDGYICNFKYGINMTPNGYKLNLAPEYKELLDCEEIILSEHGTNIIKSFF